MAAFDLQASLRSAQEAYHEAFGPNGLGERNYHDSTRNFFLQSALADQANAREIEMWEMQNRYNSPAAQMSRFSEAGLNPMLIYQQGNPGNASSAPGTHVPNAELHENADRQAEINNVLNIVSAVSGAIGQVFGTIDQGLDLAIKQNDLKFSNYQIAGANQIFQNFGGRGSSAYLERFLPGFDYSSAMDPNSPDFNPALFGFFQRIGATGASPRMLTAEANAALSGKRSEYQDWYNNHYAPLLEDFMQGKIDLQGFEKRQAEYQQEMLEMLPPWARALILPIFDYIRPFINSMLRR